MWSKPPKNVPFWGTNPEMSILSSDQWTNAINVFGFHSSTLAVQYSMKRQLCM